MNLTEAGWAALRLEIQRMTYKDPLYKVLKEELSKLGHWKNRARGDGGNPRHFFLSGRGKAKAQGVG
jgi:hypothetical protein